MDSDAWIFSAIPPDGRKVDLADIVGMADALNKCLPDRDELEHGLNRLMKAGYLAYQGNLCWLTPEGAQARQSAEASAKRIFDLWDALETKMCEQDEKYPSAQIIALTWEQVQEAYSIYRIRFNERYSKIKENDLQ